VLLFHFSRCVRGFQFRHRLDLLDLLADIARGDREIVAKRIAPLR
jgi:hypothetical protein